VVAGSIVGAALGAWVGDDVAAWGAWISEQAERLLPPEID
jgi:hypothetical protein